MVMVVSCGCGGDGGGSGAWCCPNVRERMCIDDNLAVEIDLATKTNDAPMMEMERC